MNTIEIIIYTGIAVIVIGLGLNFIISLDSQKYYDSLEKTITEDDSELEYTQTNPLSFVKEIIDVWEACGKGEITADQTVYVSASDTTSEIDKEFIFDQIKDINYCNQLQSAEYNCGAGEDLELRGDIDLPAVVLISCNSERIELII